MLKDPEKLKKVSEIGAQDLREYGKFSDTCKRIAASRRANSPIRQETHFEYINRVEQSVEDCSRIGKP